MCRQAAGGMTRDSRQNKNLSEIAKDASTYAAETEKYLFQSRTGMLTTLKTGMSAVILFR